MRTQNASVNGILLIAVLVSTSLSTTAFAQSKKSVEPPPASGAMKPAASVKPGEDKVDISDLENKYWAPKDTDFSVVQNRTYAKEGRFFISPQWGRPINDPYSEGSLIGGSLNYFWSERMGVQATYLVADLENNDATNDLAGYGSGVQPDHGKMKGYYGIGLNVVPFYAKMSFWGKRILYFDMAFTPTLGMTSYEQQIEFMNKTKSAFTYGFDITQYFFFAKWFAVRADLRNQWHSEEIVKFRNSTGYVKGQKVTDKVIHDSLFLLGLTFYF